MAFLNGFESTNTSAFSMQRNTSPDFHNSDRNDFPLVNVICEMLSDPLRTAQSLLDQLSEEGIVTLAHINHVHGALAVVRIVYIQSQQIASWSSWRLRQSHEKLKLDDLLRNSLMERQAPFRQHGVELQRSLKPDEIHTG